MTNMIDETSSSIGLTNRPTLLIVDDDPVNIKLLEAMLDKKKYNILKADNGEDAIVIAETSLPDAILLDVMMPSMSGFDVTTILKKNPETSGIPIILLTALDNPEQKKRGLECGAEEFLNKPIKTLELLSRVNSMLRLRLYEEEVSIRYKSRDGYSDQIIQDISKEDNSLPRILVVEDNEKDIKLIQAHLESTVFAVTYVKTGEEAIRIISDGTLVSLIILDVMLPDINGFDLCRQIKTIETTHNVPIIFATHLTDYDSKIRSIEVESDGFLAKPLDKKELLSRVRVLLKKKETVDSLALDRKLILQSAITDGLTKLYNYAYFKHALDQEITRSIRQQQHFGLLLMDVDNFKIFNDTLGHLKGDLILQLFGDLLKKNTRAMDIVARYGGEEFAMILPNTQVFNTVDIAERIRRSVEEFLPPFQLPTALPRLTISVGAAVYPTDAKNADGLIKMADEMLYVAKRNGKNQVRYMAIGG